ncbi:PQQ-binding-like beta-propeller repeat protein [Micromonospora sp. MS34]|uniref:outer membrane protein assembly factor BamB family protein n=1 Tax=Micromonospora sp. MS34 TaxID=3385971 RepID=UPI0039A3252D
MAIIDLGELRDDVTPGLPARRRPADRRPYRFVAALVVALVTLASATPGPERVTATAPGGTVAAPIVVDDRVYLVQPPDPERGVGRQLIAYRMTGDGLRTLWRTLLPGGGVPVGGIERAGRLLVYGRSADEARWESMAVELRTGRVGWQLPGVVVAAGDAVLLHTVASEGADEVRRVDVATGRTLWTVAAPADVVNWSVGPAGVERLVLVPAIGPVAVHDAVSGVRLVARDLHPGELPARRRILVAAGLLLEVSDAGASVAAYDLDTLERRWTASLPLVGFVQRCGRLLCAARQAGGMWALDPGTGRIAWTNPRWQAVLAASGGRLLVTGMGTTAPEHTVVEVATGRVLAELGDWGTIPLDASGALVVGVRRAADGRLLVAELDPAADRARVRDAVPGATGDCRASVTVLVCRRSDGAFGVWRIG